MTERPSHSEPGEEERMRVDLGPAPSPPRWMTVAGTVVVILVILAFVVLHLSGVMGSGGH
jgi:hypothetical protein